MPQPRFVEVVDVGAEASSTIAALLSSGQGLVGKLSFNITDYINSTYDRDALLEKLAFYNVTELPASLINALNLTEHEEYVPIGRARQYLLLGTALLVLRELYVRVRVARVLKQYGTHAH